MLGASDPKREPTSPAGRSEALSRSVGGSGGAALAGDVLLAELAALLLGGAAPDAGVLVGGEGVLEAQALGLALAADGLGVLDLLDGRAGGADREEEVGIGVTARARSRQSSRSSVSWYRGRLWARATTFLRGELGSRNHVCDGLHMPPWYPAKANACGCVDNRTAHALTPASSFLCIEGVIFRA